jgi:transposase
MKIMKARRLAPYEGLKLHRMKRQLTNQVNHRHVRIILLSRGGLSNAQIATQCACTAAWVRQILHRFNAGGIEAITWYPHYCSPTGPRKFMAEVVEQICELALAPPKKLIGLAVWCLSKLCEYLQKQKIVNSISLEWLRQLLRRRPIDGHASDHPDLVWHALRADEPPQALQGHSQLPRIVVRADGNADHYEPALRAQTGRRGHGPRLHPRTGRTPSPSVVVTKCPPPAGSGRAARSNPPAAVVPDDVQPTVNNDITRPARQSGVPQSQSQRFGELQRVPVRWEPPSPFWRCIVPRKPEN